MLEVAFCDHGGRCLVPHWGSVIEGELVVGYGDGREERHQAGEVFYRPVRCSPWSRGHTARTDTAVRTVGFSPGGPMAEFVARVSAVLERSGG